MPGVRLLKRFELSVELPRCRGGRRSHTLAATPAVARGLTFGAAGRRGYGVARGAARAFRAAGERQIVATAWDITRRHCACGGWRGSRELETKPGAVRGLAPVVAGRGASRGLDAVARAPYGEGRAKGGRNLTVACTRPPTRRLLSTSNLLGRRVMPGVRQQVE